MRVQYHFNSFDERRMLTAISNLLLYYNDVSVNVRHKLALLQKESRIRDMLVQHLRKGTGNTAITIDNVFSAVEAAVSCGDIFWFEVDGKRFCDLLKDKESLDIVFQMQDNYFLTESAMTKFYPSKNWLIKKYQDGIKGEQEKWLDWVDSNWRKDRKIMNTDFTRTILEE